MEQLTIAYCQSNMVYKILTIRTKLEGKIKITFWE